MGGAPHIDAPMEKTRLGGCSGKEKGFRRITDPTGSARDQRNWKGPGKRRDGVGERGVGRMLGGVFLSLDGEEEVKSLPQVNGSPGGKKAFVLLRVQKVSDHKYKVQRRDC